MLFIINWCFETFLKEEKSQPKYALPDKLTLELILAQLILQCLIMKEKSITVRHQGSPSP